MLTLADSTNLTDAFALTVVGMLVVFSALILLMLVIAWIVRLLPEQEAPEPPLNTPNDVGAPQMAVIVAAATAALQRPVRITSVKEIKP